jgi:hypothetical protein
MRHDDRVAASAKADGDKKRSDKVLPRPVLARPSESFYKKLTAALKEKGLSASVPRNQVPLTVLILPIARQSFVRPPHVDVCSLLQWPKDVLARVYHELRKEVPSDLFARELWMASAAPADWHAITSNFTRSTAVMSMIGCVMPLARQPYLTPHSLACVPRSVPPHRYIFGLGDRHLDNMLLDFTTGEIVHIDYNVCFEKGRWDSPSSSACAFFLQAVPARLSCFWWESTSSAHVTLPILVRRKLRVPEIVDFRLTPNVLRAFGITGAEGTFRRSCEHVLRLLRRNRETLLTLLEAFV